jgi:hypothetical protein
MGSGAICEIVNHQGHEGTQRKNLRRSLLPAREPAMMAEFPAATEVITNRRCNQTMGSSVDFKHLVGADYTSETLSRRLVSCSSNGMAGRDARRSTYLFRLSYLVSRGM